MHLKSNNKEMDIMKKFILALLFVLLLICAGVGVWAIPTLVDSVRGTFGSGQNFSTNVVTRTDKVSDYTALEVSNSLKVEVSDRVSAGEVLIEAPENMMENIVCQVESGVLKLKLKSSGKSVFNYDSNPHIYINPSKLEIVTASGSSEIEVKRDLGGESLAVTLSGSSDMKFLGLNYKDLVFASSGSSEFDVKGVIECESLSAVLGGSSDLDVHGVNAKNFSLTLSASSDVSAKSIDCTDFIFTASGSSEAEIEALNTVNATITLSSSSELEIKRGGAKEATIVANSSSKMKAENWNVQKSTLAEKGSSKVKFGTGK